METRSYSTATTSTAETGSEVGSCIILPLTVLRSYERIHNSNDIEKFLSAHADFLRVAVVDCGHGNAGRMIHHVRTDRSLGFPFLPPLGVSGGGVNFTALCVRTLK